MDKREKLIELICDNLQVDGCIAHCNYPPCDKCKNTATFNLWMQLKPLCTAISRAVTMSHIVGYDEHIINQMQREKRALKGVE